MRTFRAPGPKKPKVLAWWLSFGTRRDLVSPERRDALRRVLRAVAAKRPSVGYAQGMRLGPTAVGKGCCACTGIKAAVPLRNQLAAVLLKLGFDEDKSCWMMDAIMEEKA